MTPPDDVSEAVLSPREFREKCEDLRLYGAGDETGDPRAADKLAMSHEALRKRTSIESFEEFLARADTEGCMSEIKYYPQSALRDRPYFEVYFHDGTGRAEGEGETLSEAVQDYFSQPEE